MNNLKSFFQKSKILTTLSLRSYCHGELKPVEYPGFKYYPRDKNFKDPTFTPSKLFLIRRIKSPKGTTKEEKQCLEALKICGKNKYKEHIAVVQNIPEINALLWQVKHLVDIKPIFWKGELPKDGLGTFLRMTGELVISPKIKSSEEQIALCEKHFKENNKIGRLNMKRYLLKKWVAGY